MIRVFISSTSEDLGFYRTAARDAVLGLEMHPSMFEYFQAASNPPLQECLARVRDCDVLVVLVAHRYGWIPQDQPGRHRKSITWLECEEALKSGKDVLAFLVEESMAWPEQSREEFEMARAIRGETKASALPIDKLLADIQRRFQRLQDFKKWLAGRGIVSRFQSADDLKVQLVLAVQKWRHHRLEKQSQTPAAAALSVADPAAYLTDLLGQTAYIAIRGLATAEPRAHQLPIGDLYVPLRSSSPAAERSSGREERKVLEFDRHANLEELLSQRKLVITGDPGSGKSTFLKRIANEAARLQLKVPVSRKLIPETLTAPFPFLVRLNELASFMTSGGSTAGWETFLDFLEQASVENKWGLEREFFMDQLERDSLLLLDGLDEAGDDERSRVSRVVEELAQHFSRCTVVVTSRPVAYSGEVVLSGFAHARIEPLDDAAMIEFLEYWCGALYANAPAEAERHRAELEKEVRESRQILRMARNPVMLTAFAVLHWNSKRLPEQRAELYESILNWLVTSRPRRASRLSPDRAMEVFCELAWRMQTGEGGAGGRVVQIPKEAAAKQIQRLFHAPMPETQLQSAMRFLSDEELDSGIVVGRGGDVRFWHLTFQEFLAARELSGRREPEQQAELTQPSRLYSPEWREVLLLFAGILASQGRRKLDGFVESILAHAGPSRSARARCVGLLGAIARDAAPAGYSIEDDRYRKMLEDVMTIFEPSQRLNLTIAERIEAAEALGQAGDPRLDGKEKDRWVRIPSATFWMGAQHKSAKERNYDKEAYEDESPVHEVSLDAYEIAKYPVTVQEYAEFIEDKGYEESKWWAEGGFKMFELPDAWADQQYPNRPIVGVSWYESAAYATWKGCRLPTEAEWERAARGLDARSFPWGNNPPSAELLNFNSEVGRPTPVGLYARGATPEGVMDMAGNVWEWCEDGLGAYPAQAQINPLQTPDGGGHVLRGGSWGNNVGDARPACRYWLDPDVRSLDIGFRLVRRRQDS